jgi:hypothetical protein
MLGFVSTTLGSDLRIGLVQSDGGGFCGFELLRGDLPARDVVPGTSPVAKPTIADPLAVRVAALEGALEDLRLAKNREVETLESSVHVLDERLNDVENETCDMMYLSDATSRRITAGDDDKVLLGTVLEVITERLERLEGAADDASAEVKYKPEKSVEEDAEEEGRGRGQRKRAEEDAEEDAEKYIGEIHPETFAQNSMQAPTAPTHEFSRRN